MSDSTLVDTVAASVYSVGAFPMVITIATPGGVGKAADPDIPVDAITGALLAADVWIEFNHQWLLYSTPFERAMKNNAKLRYMCLVDFSQELLIRTVGNVETPQLQKFMGIDVEPMMPALDQMGENIEAALDNINKILTKCREKGIRPIHIHIQSYLPDAKDTGRLHTSAGMFYPPTAQETVFCEKAKPLDGEIVLQKTCSGIHVGTPIDRILRNLNIKNVIVTGFYTDQCFSTSVRDLADLGYAVDMKDSDLEPLLTLTKDDIRNMRKNNWFTIEQFME